MKFVDLEVLGQFPPMVHLIDCYWAKCAIYWQNKKLSKYNAKGKSAQGLSIGNSSFRVPHF